MWENVKKIFEFSAKVGFFFPGAYDSNTDKASTSLLFANISFYIACASVLTLMYKDIILGTVGAITLSVIYFIFYMLRKLNKAKFDIDDRSFDLENNEGEDKK